VKPPPGDSFKLTELRIKVRSLLDALEPFVNDQNMVRKYHTSWNKRLMLARIKGSHAACCFDNKSPGLIGTAGWEDLYEFLWRNTTVYHKDITDEVQHVIGVFERYVAPEKALEIARDIIKQHEGCERCKFPEGSAKELHSMTEAADFLAANGLSKKSKSQCASVRCLWGTSVRHARRPSPRGHNFLLVTSHSPAGGAEAFAKVTGSAVLAGGANGEGGIALKVACNHARKKSLVRFQTQFQASGGPISMTFDSRIAYTRTDVTIGCELTHPKVQFIGGKERPAPGQEKVERLAAKLRRKARFNRMSYRTSVAVWRVPFASSFDDTSREVELLCGSGVIFGESFATKNLQASMRKFLVRHAEGVKSCTEGAEVKFDRVNALKGSDPAVEKMMSDHYLTVMAQSLHVDPARLVQFFTDPGVQSLIQDEKTFPESKPGEGPNGSVLIEAAFRIEKANEVKATCQLKQAKDGVYVVLASDVPEKMFEKVTASASASLESIRLRYRKKDFVDDGKSLFKLGMTIAGSGAAIELRSVDEAGSDAIIDLATVWFHADLISATGDVAYERAVPAAILFAQ
jgi:hypothetical protein